MKKVYVPTTEELYIMQDKGMNVYKYLLVKAIESIIMDAKLNGGNDRSILNNIYKYLRENPYIYYAICKLYPEEIQYSKMAQNDIKLCLELISQTHNQDTSIYNLDNLSYFDDRIATRSVVDTTLRTLLDKLPQVPKYRFEYRPSSLLDDIFNCELQTFFISTPTTDLARIEPAYLLRERNGLSDSKDDMIRYNSYINQYASRYGISALDCYEYYNQDILTNPDTEVKRLLKCINQRKAK